MWLGGMTETDPSGDTNITNTQFSSSYVEIFYSSFRKINMLNTNFCRIASGVFITGWSVVSVTCWQSCWILTEVKWEACTTNIFTESADFTRCWQCIMVCSSHEAQKEQKYIFKHSIDRCKCYICCMYDDEIIIDKSTQNLHFIAMGRVALATFNLYIFENKDKYNEWVFQCMQW